MKSGFLYKTPAPCLFHSQKSRFTRLTHHAFGRAGGEHLHLPVRGTGDERFARQQTAIATKRRFEEGALAARDAQKGVCTHPVDEHVVRSNALARPA